MKDYFSEQSKQYSQFRPSYPAALYDFILSLVSERKTAWDAGTGNGQVAAELAKHFEKVFATDISENQIKNAVVKENIFYKIENAEQTSFADHTFDLITVAQAIHWFEFDAFYSEVKRTLKPDGIIAVIGYGLMRIDSKIDSIIDHFYDGILASYWNPERRYIDESYLTIPFPFKEIEHPVFINEYYWDLDHLINFLETWSAVRHYMKEKNKNPLDEIMDDLKNAFGENEKRKVVFPVLLKAGINER